MGTSSLDLPVVWKDWMKRGTDTDDTWRQSGLMPVEHVLHLRLQLPFHQCFLKNLWHLKARFHCRNFRGILWGRGHWCVSPLQELPNWVLHPGYLLRSEQNQNVTWTSQSCRNSYSLSSNPCLPTSSFLFSLWLFLLLAAHPADDKNKTVAHRLGSNGHSWHLWKVLTHSGDSTIERAKWEERFL